MYATVQGPCLPNRLCALVFLFCFIVKCTILIGCRTLNITTKFFRNGNRLETPCSISDSIFFTATILKNMHNNKEIRYWTKLNVTKNSDTRGNKPDEQGSLHQLVDELRFSDFLSGRKSAQRAMLVGWTTGRQLRNNAPLSLSVDPWEF